MDRPVLFSEQGRVVCMLQAIVLKPVNVTAFGIIS